MKTSIICLFAACLACFSQNTNSINGATKGFTIESKGVVFVYKEAGDKVASIVFLGRGDRTNTFNCRLTKATVVSKNPSVLKKKN